jgi:hypothetical protein
VQVAGADDPRTSQVAETIDLARSRCLDHRWALAVGRPQRPRSGHPDRSEDGCGRRCHYTGAHPSALVYDGESLWAAALKAEKVFRIRLSDASVIQTISVEGAPIALQSLSCGDGCWDIWTADESADAVSRIRSDEPPGRAIALTCHER